LADRLYYKIAGVIVFFGSLPLWVFALLFASFFLLVLSWVVWRTSRAATWAALLLFVLWALQVTHNLGVYYSGGANTDYSPQPSVWVQPHSFGAKTLGLGLLVSTLVAVAIIDRLWKQSAEGAERKIVAASPGLESTPGE
jgi:hypothetical protein